MLKLVLLSVVVLVAAMAVLVFCGTLRWQAETKRLHARLQAARVQAGIKTYDPREIAELPAPVQRYFRAVLKTGQPLIAIGRVAHTGTFNMGGNTDQWRPFTSTQRVTTQSPGFVWDARIRMAPGLTVFVHDAYIAGSGVLVAKLLGLFEVMAQPSTPELAQGELMRFLAEGPWYPTALLPSQGVRWEALDDTRARATLTDHATTVTLVVDFDTRGLIRAVHSDGRYRDVDGVQVATPWQGRFWDYELRDGMRVPLQGEVSWVLPDGPRPYWRGRIQHVAYAYAQ